MSIQSAILWRDSMSGKRPELRVEVTNDGSGSDVPESEVISLAGPAAVEAEGAGGEAAPKRMGFTPRALLGTAVGLMGMGRTPRGSDKDKNRVSVNPITLAAADATYTTELQQQEGAAEQVTTGCHWDSAFWPGLKSGY